jgi:pyruvate/2-oxoglutarate/acetoin dehydrogenase E1 component
MTWLQAANLALREEMARDDSIFVMGEDVEAALFGLSAGLVAEFGQERVRNTPIVEETIVGAGVGAAMVGLRPFVDLNIATFAYTAFDQIVNQVAKNRFLFGGQAKLPMVIFLNEFHRSYTAAQHTDRPHGLFMAMPGLKVLAPGTPADAKGLIKSAIRSDDPHGIRAEVLDLRTLAPLDDEAIIASVAKTGRLVVVDTAHHTAGAAAEIAAIAAEYCFDDLKAPVIRVTTPDIHIPFSPPLERTMFPTPDDVVAAVLKTVQPAVRTSD